MDNRNIIIIIIIILIIYILFCQNKIDNNFENLTNNTNRSLIGESIKNLGIIMNEINKNDLIIPSNLITNGNSFGIPLYYIILWPKEEPPFPNTLSFPITENTYDFNNRDCWYPCIGGTINVDGVDINIPNMRNKMLVGYGATNDSGAWQHQYFNLGSHVGGEVPLRWHVHTGYTTSTSGHNHQIPIIGGNGWSNPSSVGIHRSWFSNWFLSDEGGIPYPQYLIKNSGHSHSLTVHNTGYGPNNFTKNTIPHSTVLQYWIKIR